MQEYLEPEVRCDGLPTFFLSIAPGSIFLPFVQKCCNLLRPSGWALPVRSGTRASGACFFEDAGAGLIYYGAFPDFMPNDSITAPLSTLERFPAGSQR